ncbi:MAG TPA: DUF998 domain-containing protein [Gemmatimonadaceae bacterium]|nr:DUF998 domain-containing protein [Gemmatimonadaceae bacterium]
MAIDQLSETRGLGAHRTVEAKTLAEDALIWCGVFASVAYLLANVLGAAVWPGYSSLSQTVSELSAIGAPSRPVVAPLLVAYAALIIAFGAGVRAAGGRSRALRVTGVILIVYGIVCLAGPFTPMHQRVALAAGQESLTDALHKVTTSVDVLLIVLITAIGGQSFHARFRAYSIATIIVVLVLGALTVPSVPRIAANLPTPGVGALERVCIGAAVAWPAVLAVMILRRDGDDLSPS